MLKLLGIFIATIIVQVGSGAIFKSNTVVVSPKLKSRLVAGETPNFFVSLKDRTRPVLEAIGQTRFADRSAKLNALYEGLTRHAAQSQKPIIGHLKSNNVSYTSFWITNQVYIQQGHLRLALDLESNFENLISSVDEEQVDTIPPVITSQPTTRSKAQQVAWGVQKIQAPQAWEYLGKEFAAAGVIVATVDSGVRGTHEALRDNFVGRYGWFDPSTKTPTPNDDDGHGTHVTGTIVGGLGIGVAPSAKWAACRGCIGGSCPVSYLIACGQFVVCPTLADESNPDCSKAPHIVSNSWGSGVDSPNDPWRVDMIAAYHAAGIMPIFSIGNSGSAGCSTAGSPGNMVNVIGVGSTTNDDSISGFSSLGPAPGGGIKPDVSAPGSGIVSASHTADNAYVTYSGTSMACPHVAGVVALLLTNDKEVKFEEVKSLLFSNTDRQLKFSGRTCGGTPDNVFPNNVFGHGRVNASRAVRAFMPNPTFGKGGVGFPDSFVGNITSKSGAGILEILGFFTCVLSFYCVHLIEALVHPI